MLLPNGALFSGQKYRQKEVPSPGSLPHMMQPRMMIPHTD